MRKLYFLLFAFAICLGAKSQVSVSATAGTTGPTSYTTISEAFAAINAGTHEGDISIMVTGNTTEPSAPVALLKSATPSNYTSVLIRPSGGSWTINSAAAPVANRGVIELSGADNVTIDGDDPGTAGTRNLTVQVATNTVTGSAAIRLSSNSTTGADGADNITVKNCIIIGGRTSATSTTASYGINMSNYSTTSMTTGAYSSLNTRIENNIIRRAYHGVFANGGSATYPNTGIIIKGNQIGSAVSADNIGFRGILISNTSATEGAGSAIIEENDIRVGNYESGFSASVAGIEVGATNAGSIIRRNNIHDVYQPSASGYGAFGISITSATNNAGIRIQNNFIRDVVASRYSTSLTSTFENYGIYISAGATDIKINYNTIALLVPNTTGSVVDHTSACVMVTSSAAVISEFQNNILVNRNSSAQAMAFYSAGTGNLSTGMVDYNDYYVPNGNIGYFSGSMRAMLSDWQAATTKDANSVSVNPPFISATDLHISTTIPNQLESGGVPVAGITLDIDGNTRHATTPDIGADEFTGVRSSPCVAPTTQPTGLTFGTSTSTTTEATFTAASGNPSGYLVVRSKGALNTLPTDLTVYSSGAAIGNGTVVASTATPSFTSTGMVGNTEYTYTLFSYSWGDCVGGPLYNTNSPLSGSAVTCSDTPGSLTISNLTTSGFELSWASAIGSGVHPVSYTIEVATDAAFTSMVSGSPFSVNDPTLNLVVTGLNDATNYYYRILSNNTLCNSAYAGGMITTLCGPASLPYEENFNSATTPNLPMCTSREDLNGGNTWRTASTPTSPPGMTGNVLEYPWNGTTPGDDWFYTRGLPLTAGTTYELTFSYGNNSTFYVEKMKVAFGMSPSASAMTTVLADYPNITGNVKNDVLIYFTPATTGVHYVGFHAYSDENMFNLVLDDIKVRQAPSCIAPSNVTVAGITESSITVAFDCNSCTGGSFIVEYGPAGFTPGTDASAGPGGTVVTGAASPITFSGLIASTAYEVYVRRDCGSGDYSENTAVRTFTTQCDPVVSFIETFDAVSTPALPPCWEKVSTTGSVNTQTTNPSSAPNTLYFYSPNATSRVVVSLPPVSNLSDGTHQLTFKTRAVTTTGGRIEIGYLTNPANAASFVPFDTVIATSTTYQLFTVIPESSIPASVQTLAFRHTGSPANSVLIDDVEWDLKPPCVIPAGLSATNITNSSASVSFTCVGCVDGSYIVEYGPTGFSPGLDVNAGPGGTVITGLTSPISITGLMASTQYEVYVRRDCGAGSYSDNSAVLVFTTACDPATIPYMENFDNATTPALPMCTSLEDLNGATTWRTITAPTSSPTGFTGNVLQYTYSSSVAANDWFFTQGLDLTGGSTYMVTYKYANNNSSYVEKMKVAYGTSPGSTSMTTVLADHPNISNVTVTSGSVRFTPSTSGVYYIGFHAYSIANQWLLYLDDIEVVEIPTCAGVPYPGTLEVSGGNTVCVGSSVTITTIGLPDEAGLTFQWQSSADGVTWADISGATSESYVATPTADTYYRLTVTCTNGNMSASTSPEQLIVINPQVLTTTGASRCGRGTVDLEASSSGGSTLYWYQNASGGLPIGTGPVFTTPAISSTTTYYVAAAEGSTYSVGLPDNTGSYGTYGNPLGTGYGLYFTTSAPITINHVYVYPQSAGSVTIVLQDGSGAAIPGATATVSFTASEVNQKTMVPLAFDIPNPGNYRLMNTAGVFLGRYNPYSGPAFPMDMGAISITQGSLGTGTYYSFFDLNISEGCSSPRVAVEATVTTAPTVTLSATNMTVCSGQPVTLSVTSSNTDYSYNWSPSGDIGSSTTVNPTSTTTYYLNAVDSSGGTYNTCAILDSIKINTQAVPSPISFNPANPLVCATGTVPQKLSVIGGALNKSTTLGTQSTTTSTAGITPFNSNWEGSRTQYLITAAELNAAGVQAGNISGLSFRVTASGSGAVPQTNFTIKMGATSDAAMGSAYKTPSGGFTTVYTAASVPAPAVGIRTFEFDTPFVWDGVSNVLVDICHDNDIDGTCSACYSSNSTVAATTTSFRSVWGSYGDNQQSCGVQASSTISSYTTRPLMTFMVDSAVNMTWSPTAGLYTDAAGTVAYTGSPATMVYALPTTNTTYTVTAVTDDGCSTIDSVEVVLVSMPVITTQPQSQDVCAGSPLTLTAAVSGEGLSYQWKRGGFNIQGATQLVLTINNPTTSASGDYTLEINSPCGIVVSDVATVVVTPATIITTQPIDQNTCVGGSATFSVVSSGSNLTYQWRKDGSDITGATSSTFSIASVTTGDVGEYSVLVTGTCGAQMSDTVILETNVVTSITTQPVDQEVCTPGSASFTVAASGPGTLTYQWQKDGTDITGATSDTYSIANVSASDAGVYSVVVSGTCGTATSANATLTVNTAPVVTSAASGVVCSDDAQSYTFTSTESGATYVWSRAAVSGISNAPVSGQSGTEITEALVNTSSAPVDVIYSIIPSAGGCTGDAFIYTVTVNPRPEITSASSAEICDNTAQNYVITSDVTGATYVWSRAAVTGISNVAAEEVTTPQSPVTITVYTPASPEATEAIISESVVAPEISAPSFCHW